MFRNQSNWLVLSYHCNFVLNRYNVNVIYNRIFIDFNIFEFQLRSNLISQGGIGSLIGDVSSADGAGSSSTSSNNAEKPKATDISHLIKRKKPDSSTEDAKSADNGSPAKKAAH